MIVNTSMTERGRGGGGGGGGKRVRERESDGEGQSFLACLSLVLQRSTCFSPSSITPVFFDIDVRAVIMSTCPRNFQCIDWIFLFFLLSHTPDALPLSLSLSLPVCVCVYVSLFGLMFSAFYHFSISILFSPS